MSTPPNERGTVLRMLPPGAVSDGWPYSSLVGPELENDLKGERGVSSVKGRLIKIARDARHEPAGEGVRSVVGQRSSGEVHAQGARVLLVEVEQLRGRGRGQQRSADEWTGARAPRIASP